jgi:hypothetical protein
MGSNGRPTGTVVETRSEEEHHEKLVIIIAAALAWGSVSRRLCAGRRKGPRPARDPIRPSRRVPTSPSASATVTSPTPPATPRTSTTAPPTPDPTALADGTYPTFVRAVDLDGATVEVGRSPGLRWGRGAPGGDRGRRVLERCSLQPGLHPEREPAAPDAPVARDAHIKLLGMCEAPSRSIGPERNCAT